MSKFDPTNIKGASDFLPATQIMRNKIIDTLKNNFEAFGFLPLETALLNYYELLSYKYDDKAEILKEIYKIKDQGDRDLGLRFDLTVPFCKVIAMNRNLRMPFKRYEIGKVFRNGPVKLGRTREFYQCDVDCVGVAGPHIEAELVMLTVKCFKALGIEPLIKIGNRGRLVEAIQKAGISDTTTALATLDKDGVIKGLKAPARDDELFGVLDSMGLSKYVEHAPYLARGLNIYTGTVWEVYDKAKRLPSALGGGGRYDDIIGNFIDNNQKYPAVGISFGLEPISAILQTSDAKTAQCIDLIIIPMGTEVAAQKLAEELRTTGTRVLVYLGGKAVGKALEYANAEGIPFACVLGENELKSGQISIKDMASGKQSTFPTKDTKAIMQFIKRGAL